MRLQTLLCHKLEWEKGAMIKWRVCNRNFQYGYWMYQTWQHSQAIRSNGVTGTEYWPRGAPILPTRANTGHAVLQSTPKPPQMRRRKGLTDRPTDGRTDGQTPSYKGVMNLRTDWRITRGWRDRPSYRGVSQHLKKNRTNLRVTNQLDQRHLIKTRYTA